MHATILNVDDNEIGRYARSRFLIRAGYNVIEARNGTEALRLTRESQPDLILLDINLPDVNGIEVCRTIKGDPATERTPVLFLSAARLADPDVVLGLDAGGDNYLREPVDPAVLMATIRALLRAREAEEELARSNEQLRRFAFVVSHELQEPLRMVKAYTQLLAKRIQGQLDKPTEEYVSYVVDGANRMEKFIHDMLSYSQSAESQLELAEAPLQVALDMALLELGATIRDAGAKVSSGSLPAVQMDAVRMSQVFRNLIGNAIKYRSAEPPLIHVSAVARGSEWVVSVSDNGVGIDSRYADAVFVLFKRLHGREKSGSGVGLAVCKEIVEHHGGRIWFDSTPGEGSTFHFTLPR